MSYDALRQSFLSYFQKNQHTIVDSSSLVPAEDPTLLFTNAGMNQFKDLFLGIEHRGYQRAATAQRCVRAGGKHNDLENVGYTARHHTFFEMLGNFSFGDYFKKDAIKFALDFVTKELKLPLEKLWFTVHYGDDESFDIWNKDMGIPADRIVRCGDKDNFWAMGDVGPCGPCTEIFYDHGPSVAGGPPGSAEADGDRYMEIWNLVFMQFHRQADGQLIPLPKPCVDTGMGLERLACVMEGVTSNFDTSLFKTLKDDIRRSVLGKPDNSSLNVIADHLRSAVFLIADGITPSADGRGYVLRRIIRRALRHGYKMGVKTPFIHQHVAALVNLMKSAYPYLVDKQAYCEKVLLQEQQLFFETLQSGMKYFENYLQTQPKLLSGEVLFKLYDTYGFPIDIALDEAKERGLECDRATFEKLMDDRKKLSRQSSKFDMNMEVTVLPAQPSEFLRNTLTASAQILGVLEIPDQKDFVWVCTNQTPFYAESGGQVGDQGLLRVQSHELQVYDTQKMHHQILMLVDAHSLLVAGETVHLAVDENRRQAVERHHTATHVLHAALRTVLGPQVQQRGSLVAADRLRFDFAYDQALTQEQLRQIESYCQQAINADEFVKTDVLDKEEALEAGALAFFGDKYGQKVRMLSIGDNFSKELCGGTHVHSLAQLHTIVITAEESVAAGVRRLQALAGDVAINYLKEIRGAHLQLAQDLEIAPEFINDQVKKIQHQLRDQQQQLDKLYQQELVRMVHDTSMKQINAAKVVVLELPAHQSQSLKLAADALKQRSDDLVGLMYTLIDDKFSFVLTCSSKISSKIDLKKIFESIKKNYDLKGGGRPDLIQAGGTGFDKKMVGELKDQFHQVLEEVSSF
jgi:alanyl-tRNA synthetase